MRLIAPLSVLMLLALVVGSYQSVAGQLAGLGLALALGAALSWHILRSPKFEAIPLYQVLLLALGLRGLALFAQPMLEDDYFRYLWDGYRFATSGSPYGPAPASFFADTQVPLPFQSILNFINYPDIPTIYGPVMQYWFLLGYGLAPGQVAALQWQNALLDLGIIALLVWAGAKPRYVLLYALNPLILKDAIGTAHPDGLLGLFALASLLLVRRPWLAGILAALALATKVAALVMIPFVLLRAGWRSVLAMGVALLACYLPFLLHPTGNELLALGTFAQNWRFNPLLFAPLAALLGPDWARRVAAGMLATLLLYLYFAALRQQYRARTGAAVLPLPPADWAFGLLLVLAPAVNAWYLLWLLPLAVLRPSRTAWAATFLLPLAYFNGHYVTGIGLAEFAVPLPVTLAEIGILAYTCYLDWRRPLPA